MQLYAVDVAPEFGAWVAGLRRLRVQQVVDVRPPLPAEAEVAPRLARALGVSGISYRRAPWAESAELAAEAGVLRSAVVGADVQLLARVAARGVDVVNVGCVTGALDWLEGVSR
ncbi:hypothetical protein DS6A_43 [Mycobacterium phage DS6A]|uniref:Uncharacterized protein n=1 Tax=Mycobacterium phage DS6A TaxID=45764 RepID=G8I4F3_9CAUD|nr:hypothetical protein DS6A_43 [Mycobacterium phage DS6A]AER47597.1 hypothetical protein DS6A_43 [Mycobacterium phage DS6A]